MCPNYNAIWGKERKNEKKKGVAWEKTNETRSL